MHPPHSKSLRGNTEQFIRYTVNNSYSLYSDSEFLCPSVRGGAFRFALVCLSALLKFFNFLTKVDSCGQQWSVRRQTLSDQ